MSPERRAPYRAGNRENRRQALVEAALDEIAERGFEGLRTREVAAHVGLNVATLHYYFPTKEALIRGVLDEAMRRFRSTLVADGSPADRLRNHLRAVRSLLREQPQVGAVMGELALRSARDPAVARILREMNDVWHRTLRALLRQAVRDGHLASELDSDAVAALVMSTLMNMCLPTFASPERKDQAFRQLERWLGFSGTGAARPAQSLS